MKKLYFFGTVFESTLKTHVPKNRPIIVQHFYDKNVNSFSMILTNFHKIFLPQFVWTTRKIKAMDLHFYNFDLEDMEEFHNLLKVKNYNSNRIPFELINLNSIIIESCKKDIYYDVNESYDDLLNMYKLKRKPNDYVVINYVTNTNYIIQENFAKNKKTIQFLN